MIEDDAGESRVRKPKFAIGILIVVIAAVVAGSTFFSRGNSSPPGKTQSVKSVDELIQLDLSRAVPSVRKELTRLIQLVRESPADAEAWGDLGISLLAHQLNEPAAKCFRIAAEKQPDEYQWPYLIGHALMFMDWGMSAIAFERAATLKPDYVPAHMQMVEILMKSGRLEEANARMEQLPEAVSEHPWATWQRSRLTFLQGDYETSHAQAKKLYDDGRVSREVLRHLMKVKRRIDPDANLYHIKRKLDECRVEELSWDCPILRFVNSMKVDHEAAVLTARELLAKGNARDAMNIYRVVLKSDPESPEVLFQLGQAWYQLGDLKRADATLQQAGRFEPNSFRISMLRTEIAVKLRQWDVAKSRVEEAMSVKTDSAQAYYLLALSLIHI